MKNFSREDKIINSIVLSVLSCFPWVFVIQEHEIIPVVVAVQLCMVLALNIYGGEVWDEKYYNKQCFSHVDIRDQILNMEIAAHLENERREAELKRDAEWCDENYEYW